MVHVTEDVNPEKNSPDAVNDVKIGDKTTSSSSLHSSSSLSDSKSYVDKTAALRKTTTTNNGLKRRRKKASPNIVEWIYKLLCDEKPYVRWIDKKELVFRIVDQHKLAYHWGKRGQHKSARPMTFNNFG